MEKIVEIPYPTPELDKISLPQWLTTILYTPLQQVEVDNLTDKHVWVTARRIKIPVQKMTTSHIKNCINCWNGQGNMKIPDGYLGGKEKWLKIFHNELTKRQ